MFRLFLTFVMFLSLTGNRVSDSVTLGAWVGRGASWLGPPRRENLERQSVSGTDGREVDNEGRKIENATNKPVNLLNPRAGFCKPVILLKTSRLFWSTRRAPEIKDVS
jgi:hypothetical protein